jgi:hypothetical protein
MELLRLAKESDRFLLSDSVVLQSALLQDIGMINDA